MRVAAIYARVSSERQREEHTIASQTAALIEFAKSHDLEVPKEWVFEDDGFSGATLERPGLERVRDLAAEGQIQVVLAYAPDGVKGCGASTLDASHVLVAGGTGSPVDVAGAAPARVVDLACASGCVPAVWPGVMPLVRAESFTLAQDAALIAGDDATGASRVFRATLAAITELPVKAPRRNARLIALPIKGTAAIVGGAAPIEQYIE